MFSKIKNFLIEVLTSRSKIKKLEKQLSDPRKVIEKVLGRGVDWYDWEKLDYQAKLNYYSDIQRVLTNEAFGNEVKHYLGDLIQEIAMSDNQPNRDKIMRYSINGLKAFIERLEEMQDPKIDEPTTDEVHEDI